MTPREKAMTLLNTSQAYEALIRAERQLEEQREFFDLHVMKSTRAGWAPGIISRATGANVPRVVAARRRGRAAERQNVNAGRA